jgi:hypothetical protein
LVWLKFGFYPVHLQEIMESARLTDNQRELFCKMMYEAFMEIRSLAWVGFPEQAGALADAFHNLPVYLFSPNFSWEATRMFIGNYQKKYPRVVENNVVTGSYNDYLSMLDEIEELNR